MLELHVLHVSCVDTEPVEAEHDSRAYNYIDTSMSFNSYASSFPAQWESLQWTVHKLSTMPAVSLTIGGKVLILLQRRLFENMIHIA
ncbi:unnamed protein product [Arabidopsis lyrata]|nr:unnamed protein product [Arabidopsis lyrata]